MANGTGTMSISPSDRLSELLHRTLAVGEDLDGDAMLVQQDGKVYSLLLDEDGDFLLIRLEFHPC